MFGTPTQIRTERTAPFERADFTNLSIGAWCERRESNPQAEARDFKSLVFADFTTLALLVSTLGIEPSSSVLQTGAMTTFAKLTLVPSDRIELPNPSCKGGVIPFNYEGYIALSLFPFLNPT